MQLPQWYQLEIPGQAFQFLRPARTACEVRDALPKSHRDARLLQVEFPGVHIQHAGLSLFFQGSQRPADEAIGVNPEIETAGSREGKACHLDGSHRVFDQLSSWQWAEWVAGSPRITVKNGAQGENAGIVLVTAFSQHFECPQAALVDGKVRRAKTGHSQAADVLDDVSRAVKLRFKFGWLEQMQRAGGKAGACR